jgi:Protein of unknown function (DUF2971)
LEPHDPDLLHYYCSGSTLLSVLKKREFWLTALTLSNDLMEGRWAISRYLDLFEADDRRGRIGARSAMEMAADSRVALGMCFSEERDLLSQWRGYAQGGRGVCISFKVSYLQAAVERVQKEVPKLQLVRVEYLPYLKGETAKSFHEEFGSQIEQARRGSDGDFITMGKNYEHGGHDRETATVSRFFCIKNPAFSEEREWRLLLVDYPSGIPNLEFRESNGLFSPYMAFPVDLESIASVTLGPLHPTPPTDVERMLSKLGVAASVRRSAASYVVR